VKVFKIINVGMGVGIDVGMGIHVYIYGCVYWEIIDWLHNAQRYIFPESGRGYLVLGEGGFYELKTYWNGIESWERTNNMRLVFLVLKCASGL
jgi:hypothetical protein